MAALRNSAADRVIKSNFRPVNLLFGIKNCMKTYYCWRCMTDMPFLEEDEWSKVEPLLGNAAKEIKRYRAEHGCDLATARRNVKPEATKLFEEITGMPNVHFDVIFHHRLSAMGPECEKCAQLLRTAKATYCANCGAEREYDE